MKNFKINYRNAEGQIDTTSKNVGQYLLEKTFGEQFAEVIMNQSGLSDFHFKLILETDTQIWTIIRDE